MDTGASGAKAGVASLGGGANAINIVTNEDLGGGLRGGFDGQIRFLANSGDMGSTAGGGTALFHSTNVFIGGSFGTVSVGKIIEANNCSFDPWACTGGAGLAGGVGVSSLAGAASIANSVRYVTPTINGFSASYQTSVSARTNERTLLALNYANGPLALQALSIESGATNTAIATSATGPAAFQQPSALGDDSTQRAISASYNFGPARLSITNVVSKGAANSGTLSAIYAGIPVPDRDVTALGLTVPMGATTFLAGYSKDSKAVSNADTKLSLGVNYALSKRTTIGADVFKAEGQVAFGAAATATQTTAVPFSNVGTGFVVRARHTF